MGISPGREHVERVAGEGGWGCCGWGGGGGGGVIRGFGGGEICCCRGVFEFTGGWMEGQ